MNCYVCDSEIKPPRKEKGRIKPTGSVGCRPRHEKCCPGSTKWCRYFESLPAADQSEAGRMLYDAAMDKINTAAARAAADRAARVDAEAAVTRVEGAKHG